ncbi:MAG: ribosome biogenesis GTP-binding protein YihA/YsxC [Candidatus Falkowbacteria bacterium]
MKITSAQFIKGVVGEDKILDNGISQVAFIGRSNVGKSSTINTITGEKELARVSALPGRTQEINIFFINEKFYLVDLPGYGYSKASKDDRQWLFELVNWYLFNDHYQQKKIVVIIDANIGPSKDDLEIISELEERGKNILIAANKIDKIKKSELKKQCDKIRNIFNDHEIVFYSTKTGAGVDELIDAVLK